MCGGGAVLKTVITFFLIDLAGSCTEKKSNNVLKIG